MIKKWLLGIIIVLLGTTIFAKPKHIEGVIMWPDQWTVFSVGVTGNDKLEAQNLKVIPKTINISGRKIFGKTIKVRNSSLDLVPLFGGLKKGNTAYVFLPLRSKISQEITLGIGADWWFQAWINGKELMNTLETGNLDWPPHITNYTVNAKLNKGENILAIKFISGSGSSILKVGGPEQLRKIPKKKWRGMNASQNASGAVFEIQPNYNTDGLTDISESIVVIPHKATLIEKTAAKELISYIQKSTNKKIKLISEGKETRSQNLIYLGHTKYAQKNGFFFNFLDDEQWFIKTANGNLILTGGTPRGILYSVFHFLEKVVGVRWWSPWEEFVPKHKVLANKKLALSGTPAFKLRCLNTYNLYYSKSGKERLWAPRNRINSEMHTYIPYEYGGSLRYGPPSLVHTEGHYYRMMRKQGLLKPQWVALRDGKRIISNSGYSTFHQLCLSNKEMRKAFIEIFKEQIKKTRKQKNPPMIFEISFNDISSRCKCKNCQALVKKYGGNDSGLLLDFVNQIADSIKNKYPKIIISTMAYMNTENVPEGISPRDNVMVTICDTVGNYTVPHTPETRFIKHILKKWSQVAKKIKVWDYHTTFGDYGTPIPFESTIQSDLMLYKKFDIYGVMTEYHQAIFEDMRDLRFWLLAKLFENPFQDKNLLIKDFTEGFYGPAGIYIRKYLKLLQKTALENPCRITTKTPVESFKYLTPSFILAAQKLFNDAEKVVSDCKILSRRVKHARLSIDKVTYILFDKVKKYYSQNEKSQGAFPLNREKIVERIKDTIKQQSILRASNINPYGKIRLEKDTKRFLYPFNKEILWESCDNIKKMKWNQLAWRPKSYKKWELGRISLCTTNPQEGKGSVRWVVTQQELKDKLKVNSKFKKVMLNYLHGSNFCRNKKVSFFIKCDKQNHPPIYVSIKNSSSKLVLARNQVTNGWKKIVWTLPKDARPNCTHTYFRIFTLVKDFKENDQIDICIDNMRLIR